MKKAYLIGVLLLLLNLNLQAACPGSISSLIESIKTGISNKDSTRLKEILYDWDCIDSTLTYYPIYALLHNKRSGDLSSSISYWQKVNADSVFPLIERDSLEYNELFIDSGAFYKQCSELAFISLNQPLNIYYFKRGQARILFVRDTNNCYRLLFWENLDSL